MAAALRLASLPPSLLWSPPLASASSVARQAHAAWKSTAGALRVSVCRWCVDGLRGTDEGLVRVWHGGGRAVRRQVVGGGARAQVAELVREP